MDQLDANIFVPLNSFRLDNLSRRDLIIPFICSLGQNLRKFSDMYEYKEEEISKHRPVFSDTNLSHFFGEIVMVMVMSTDSMDMNTLGDSVEDRGARCAVVHGITKSWT